MSDLERRSGVRLPTASPEEVAAEVAPFPVTTADLPDEAFFPDWRRRLARNLARRSDSRWEPLTWVHRQPDRDVAPTIPPVSPKQGSAPIKLVR